VRDEPVSVDGVAGEASAELVVDATVRHLPARELHAVERGPLSCAVVVAEQDLQVHRLGELGGAAEASKAPVELGEEGACRAVK
jgi:hypothetical protein